MITITAVTNRGETIRWNYANPQQARHCWRCLSMEHVTPDTSTPIIRAYYFGAKCKPGDGPSKAVHV